MTKPVVTQEEALEIARMLEMTGYSLEVKPNGTVYFHNSKGLQDYANAVIAAKFGEPVAYRWIEAKFNEYRYDETSFKGRKCEALYTLKKPTDKEQS